MSDYVVTTLKTELIMMCIWHAKGIENTNAETFYQILMSAVGLVNAMMVLATVCRCVSQS